MTDLKPYLMPALNDIRLWCPQLSGLALRKYQQEVALSIIDSVLKNRGLTFVVIFPRQSGKNELQAQIEAYLLAVFIRQNAEMVKVSPTWKPQSLNAMRRLEDVLSRNALTQKMWSKESGYIYRIGSARLTFLSGAPTSNVVGATATTLLQCDEAQDVSMRKWDKEINPMAASTNATRVFWGTAWTARTLLHREKGVAERKQALDGIQRVFQIDAEVVRREIPEYGRFVDGEIAKLGRNHPFIRTQYFSEEIDAETGMFPSERTALMGGSHPPITGPRQDRMYAFLIDVAGEDETAGDFETTAGDLANPQRDATALTIVEIDVSTLDDELIKAPRYLVRSRRLWMGTRHTTLFASLSALAELWDPRYIVVDATGVGAGLSSFLEKAFPSKVLPFIFTGTSKSNLGWNFIACVETGRYREYTPADPLQEMFWGQCQNTRMEILPGPGRRMRWGVPDGSRDAATGEVLHDDLVISAAMCCLLDDLDWGRAHSAVIEPADPLEDMQY